MRAFLGLSLGPLLRVAAFVDPSLIPTAFLGTCLVFGSFSLTALYSRDRTWLYLGGKTLEPIMITCASSPTSRSFVVCLSVLAIWQGTQLIT